MGDTILTLRQDLSILEENFNFPKRHIFHQPHRLKIFKFEFVFSKKIWV